MTIKEYLDYLYVSNPVFRIGSYAGFMAWYHNEKDVLVLIGIGGFVAETLIRTYQYRKEKRLENGN